MKNRIIMLAMSMLIFSPAYAKPNLTNYKKAVSDLQKAVARSEGMKIGKCEILRSEFQVGNFVILLDFDFAKPTPDWAYFRQPDGISVPEYLKYTIRDATYKNQIVTSYSFVSAGGGNQGPDDYTQYYRIESNQILVSKKTGRIVKIENIEEMRWGGLSAQFFPRKTRVERNICEN